MKKPDDPAAKAVTLELDANRFKCKILDCSKSFRKAKLLHYHMKYFHGVEKAEQDQMPMTRHMQTRGSLAHEKNSQQTSKRRRTASGSLRKTVRLYVLWLCLGVDCSVLLVMSYDYRIMVETQVNPCPRCVLPL